MKHQHFYWQLFLGQVRILAVISIFLNSLPTMLKKPLPPLNALRAFEASGRHGSLRTAAEELHVTTPAVSHQIKALEVHFGFSLLERTRRGVRLTEKGQAYFRRISRAFETISSATDEIREHDTSQALNLAIPPHFLSDWLTLRLPRLLTTGFWGNLHIIDTVRRIDFESEGIDAQVLWGTGSWTGLELEPLIEDRLCIVCSPNFIEKYGRITSLQDLSDCPLIHTDRRLPSWDKTLAAANVKRSPRAKNIVFKRPIPVAQAARRGMGLAIVSEICVADSLASGELSVPFKHEFNGSPRFSYFFGYPIKTARQKEIDRFKNWLKIELALTKAALEIHA